MTTKHTPGPQTLVTVHLLVNEADEAAVADGLSAFLSGVGEMPGPNGEPPILTDWSYTAAPGTPSGFNYGNPYTMPPDYEEGEAFASLHQFERDTAADCDRLRAALEEIRHALTHYGQRSPRAILEEALANTSPAPVESVNRELLDALKTIEGTGHSDDGGQWASNIASAAIAKAEKAGG